MESRTKRKLPSLLLLASLIASQLLQGCARLPSDYERLPLEEKVEALEAYFRQGGVTGGDATALISIHGFAAADAMLPYLSGENAEIPVYDAVEVVWFVQLRGCSLQGTEVEAELNRLRERSLKSPLSGLVTGALEAIRNDYHMPDLIDSYGRGECPA